jgi:hypothetical protein
VVAAAGGEAGDDGAGVGHVHALELGI